MKNRKKPRRNATRADLYVARYALADLVSQINELQSKATLALAAVQTALRSES